MTTPTVDNHCAAGPADAIAHGAEPLTRVCRQLARELVTGDTSPAEAARRLTAAAGAAAAAPAATVPSNLAALVEQARKVERVFSNTSVPGDLVLMTATAHAHRCLDIGIRRAQAHERN